MIGVVFLLAMAAPDTPAARAKAAEEAAFKAIDDKSWCKAKALFMEADGHAPSADFLLNAAMAAEYGGDRDGALELYARVIDKKGARAAEAKQRAAALEKRIAAEGLGTPCAAAPVAEPTPAPAQEPAPTPEPVVPAEAGKPMWPLAVAGASGAVLLIGGAVLAVGLVPWFQHAGASAALRSAEAERDDDAKALKTLQRDQADARGAWEGWGRVATVAGAASVGLGVVGVAVGATLFAVSGAE